MSNMYINKELGTINGRAGEMREGDIYFVSTYLLILLREFMSIEGERKQASYLNNVLFPIIIENKECFKYLLNENAKNFLPIFIHDYVNVGVEGAYHAYRELYGNAEVREKNTWRFQIKP